jgi:hypothetical protein
MILASPKKQWEDVSAEEVPWKDLEVDGSMLFVGMP